MVNVQGVENASSGEEIEDSDEEDPQEAYNQLYTRSLEILQENSKLKKELKQLKRLNYGESSKTNSLLDEENENLREKVSSLEIELNETNKK